LDVAQHERLAEGPGQARECGLECAAGREPLGLRFGARAAQLLGSARDGLDVERQVRAPLLLQVVESPVAQRREQPDAEPVTVAAAREIDVRADERVLHDVGCDVVIEHDRERHAIHHLLVALDEELERVAITVEHALDQLRIAHQRCDTDSSGAFVHGTITSAMCPPMSSPMRPGYPSGTNHSPDGDTNAKRYAPGRTGISMRHSSPLACIGTGCHSLNSPATDGGASLSRGRRSTSEPVRTTGAYRGVAGAAPSRIE